MKINESINYVDDESSSDDEIQLNRTPSNYINLSQFSSLHSNQFQHRQTSLSLSSLYSDGSHAENDSYSYGGIKNNIFLFSVFSVFLFVFV